ETSVPAQIDLTTKYLATLLAADQNVHTVGVMMTDTYGPGAKFIQGIRDWQYASDTEQSQNHKAERLTIYFSNVSFVGPNSLAQRLKNAGNVMTPKGAKPYSDNVYVSQVVPNYDSDNSDVVRDYMKALEASAQQPSFTSLEGYLVGRVFVAGLLAHKGQFSPAALVTTFENLPQLNLGLGASSGFSPTNHNYSKAVFGTAITSDGQFTNSYYWSEG